MLGGGINRIIDISNPVPIIPKKVAKHRPVPLKPITLENWRPKAFKPFWVKDREAYDFEELRKKFTF